MKSWVLDGQAELLTWDPLLSIDVNGVCYEEL